MQKIKTLLFNKFFSDLKIITKILDKEKININGIYNREENILMDIKSIEPQLILIIKENGNNNYECNQLIKNIKKIMSSMVIIIISISEQEIIINEVLSYLDVCKNDNNLSIIKENVNKLLIDTCSNEEIYEKYNKLLARIRFEEILDDFELTSTEKKIFYLKKVGLTRTEIAEKRIISNSTVRNQITSILKKIGGKNIKDAILKVDGIAFNKN